MLIIQGTPAGGLWTPSGEITMICRLVCCMTLHYNVIYWNVGQRLVLASATPSIHFTTWPYMLWRYHGEKAMHLKYKMQSKVHLNSFGLCIYGVDVNSPLIYNCIMSLGMKVCLNTVAESNYHRGNKCVPNTSGCKKLAPEGRWGRWQIVWRRWDC